MNDILDTQIFNLKIDFCPQNNLLIFMLLCLLPPVILYHSITFRLFWLSHQEPGKIIEFWSYKWAKPSRWPINSLHVFLVLVWYWQQLWCGYLANLLLFVPINWDSQWNNLDALLLNVLPIIGFLFSTQSWELIEHKKLQLVLHSTYPYQTSIYENVSLKLD